MSGGSCDVLVLGQEGVGKSLLVKYMRKYTTDPKEFDASLMETFPTMGVEYDEINYKKSTIKFRECGGTMSPVWPMYYKNCKMVIFCVDSTNYSQVAGATMEFYNMINHEDLKGKPILLVVSKIDLPDGMDVPYVRNMMRVEDLERKLAREKVPFAVIRSSGFTGYNVDLVLDWCVGKLSYKPTKEESTKATSPRQAKTPRSPSRSPTRKVKGAQSNVKGENVEPETISNDGTVKAITQVFSTRPPSA